jgi:hypothetical protein
MPFLEIAKHRLVSGLAILSLEHNMTFEERQVVDLDQIVKVNRAITFKNI